MADMPNGTESGGKQNLHSDYPENIIITVILTLFSVFGTTGNAFVLYVFYRKKDKNTSTVFILTLAMIDFLTCILVIPFTIVVELMEKKIGDDVACKIYSFLATCSIPFSAFIMVAIAFDRYFCICRPWIRVLDIKSAKRIIVILFVFVICLGIMTSLAHGVYQLRTGNVTSSDSLNTSNVSTYTEDMNKMTAQTKLIVEMTSVSNMDSVASDKEGYKHSGLNTSFEYPQSMGIEEVVYNGYCYPNELIIGLDFRRAYQKFYISLFIIAFATVSFLYGLIYRSILVRRSRRMKASMSNRHWANRRSTQISSITTIKSVDIQEDTHLNKTTTRNEGEKALLETTFSVVDNDDVTRTEANGFPVNRPEQNNVVTFDTPNEGMCSSTKNVCIGENAAMHNTFRKINTRKWRPTRGNGGSRTGDCSGTTTQQLLPSIKEQSQTTEEVPDLSKAINIYRQDTRKSVREKTRIANIKTASILFTVTLVFIIAFLPAWLMATKLIPPNIIGFYMHFSYNVANPIIYAFFNHTFQNEVKYMLKCQHYLA